MALTYHLTIWTTKAREWVEKSLKTMGAKTLMMKARIRKETRANQSVDQKMMWMGETSSVSTVTKRILAIPHYTHIWSKSILKVLMEKFARHQQVAVDEEDPEKM